MTKPRRKQSATTQQAITASSGNVFADLGLPHAEERLAKALLSRVIQEIVQQRGWTQARAAMETGLAASDMSDIMRGKLAKFSLERLETVILDLGMDIHMRVAPKALHAPRGQIAVELVP